MNFIQKININQYQIDGKKRKLIQTRDRAKNWSLLGKCSATSNTVWEKKKYIIRRYTTLPYSWKYWRELYIFGGLLESLGNVVLTIDNTNECQIDGYGYFRSFVFIKNSIARRILRSHTQSAKFNFPVTLFPAIRCDKINASLISYFLCVPRTVLCWIYIYTAVCYLIEDPIWF